MTDEADEPAPPEVHDQRISDAVGRLEGLAQRPPEEHVEVYEDVHRVLHESLSDAQADSDQAPAPAWHGEDPTP